MTSTIADAIRHLVVNAERAESASIEAAAQRLLVLLGLEGLRTRVVHQSCEHDIVGGHRWHELVLDGLVVWRGEWVREGEFRSRWETRWLVDLERLPQRHD